MGPLRARAEGHCIRQSQHQAETKAKSVARLPLTRPKEGIGGEARAAVGDQHRHPFVGGPDLNDAAAAVADGVRGGLRDARTEVVQAAIRKAPMGGDGAEVAAEQGHVRRFQKRQAQQALPAQQGGDIGRFAQPQAAPRHRPQGLPVEIQGARLGHRRPGHLSGGHAPRMQQGGAHPQRGAEGEGGAESEGEQEQEQCRVGHGGGHGGVLSGALGHRLPGARTRSRRLLHTQTMTCP